MRIRLTTIALDHDGRTFPEGAVVEGVTLGEGESYAENEIPLELAQSRIAAQSAEPVIDGVSTVSVVAQAAIAGVQAAVLNMKAAFTALLDAADAGDDSDKVALMHALKEGFDPRPDEALSFRGRELEIQVDQILEAQAKAAAERPKRGPKKSDPA